MTDTSPAPTLAVPYELRTDHLTLRCFAPRDAAALKDAVDTSIDHLAPWMPWATREPQSLAEKVMLMRMFRGRFDLDEDYTFGMFDPASARVLGGCGLHKRSSEGALEIGYWVRADATGRGLATSASMMLTAAAFRCLDAIRVDILIDPANAASLAVARRLGFTEEGIRRRALPGFGSTEGTHRDVVAFSMLPEELDSSPASALRIHALDAAGELIAEL